MKRIKIDELEKLFLELELTHFHINEWTFISNPTLFVTSSISTLKSNRGKVLFLPLYNLLLEYYYSLSSNISKPLQNASK